MIDVHAHFVSTAWEAAAAAVQSQRISPRVNQDWSIEQHVRVMDAHGVAVSIISLPRATLFMTGQPARDLARAMNEELAGYAARYPGRIGAFAVLPLDDIDAMTEESIYALDVLGLSGIGSLTRMDGVLLGDRRYDSWFAELNARSARLFVHPSLPPAFEAVGMGHNASLLEFMFETTRMLTNMVFSGTKLRFPDIKIISTHGGGTIPYLAHRIGVLHPHFPPAGGGPILAYDEIMSTLATFFYDLTASTSEAQLDAMRRLVPASQLLMGFDYPFMPEVTIEPAMAGFDGYRGFTRREKAQILRGNAQRLFPQFG